jgi:hypothetical protein
MMQAEMFVRAYKKGLSPVDFIEKYMNSNTVAHLDLPFDHMQWAGELYVFGSVLDEVSIKRGQSKPFHEEKMYWIGYTYRYWHFLTGESSIEIYKQADACTMNSAYNAFHTMDCSMAIDNLKELYLSKPNVSEEERQYIISTLSEYSPLV